jgi:hypothetical protein
LFGLAKIVMNDPKASIPFFKEGIPSRRLIIEMAVAFVALSLLTAFAQARLGSPGALPILGREGMVVGWLTLLLKLAFAVVMFSLIAVLMKQEAKPLGVGEGVGVVWIGSLLAMVPIFLIMVAVVLLTKGRGPLAGVVGWTAPWLPRMYSLAAIGGQTFLMMGLLKLGCWLSALLSVFVVYAGYSMMDMITKRLF